MISHDTRNSTKKRIKKRFELISREDYLQRKDIKGFSQTFQTRCNKCLACRIYKGYEWTNRLIAESRKNKTSYFITLTFREEDYSLEILTKNPARQFQLFIKKLRKQYDFTKLRYYATAELGGETLRFHYHLILFSQEHIFRDMRFYKMSNGYPLYMSATLDSIWGNGGCTLAIADSGTMKYTANYVFGKGESIWRSMSQGIGKDYILEKDANYSGLYMISGKQSPVPRFIKEKNKYKYDGTPLQKLQVLEDLKGTDEELSIKQDINARVLKKGLERK